MSIEPEQKTFFSNAEKWIIENDLENLTYESIRIDKLKLLDDIIFNRIFFNASFFNQVISKGKNSLIFKDCIFDGAFTMKNIKKVENINFIDCVFNQNVFITLSDQTNISFYRCSFLRPLRLTNISCSLLLFDNCISKKITLQDNTSVKCIQIRSCDIEERILLKTDESSLIEIENSDLGKCEIITNQIGIISLKHNYLKHLVARGLKSEISEFLVVNNTFDSTLEITGYNVLHSITITNNSISNLLIRDTEGTSSAELIEQGNYAVSSISYGKIKGFKRVYFESPSDSISIDSNLASFMYLNLFTSFGHGNAKVCRAYYEENEKFDQVDKIDYLIYSQKEIKDQNILKRIKFYVIRKIFKFGIFLTPPICIHLFLLTLNTFLIYYSLEAGIVEKIEFIGQSITSPSTLGVLGASIFLALGYFGDTSIITSSGIYAFTFSLISFISSINILLISSIFLKRIIR